MESTKVSPWEKKKTEADFVNIYCLESVYLSRVANY